MKIDDYNCVINKKVFHDNCYSITTHNTIFPELIGDDYGCCIGFCAVELNKEVLYEKYKNTSLLDKIIRDILSNIPLGESFGKYRAGQVSWMDSMRGSPSSNIYTRALYNKMVNWYPLVYTVGKDNHFIEICHDSSNKIWVIVHLGTRKAGKEVKDIFVNAGKRESEKVFSKVVKNWNDSLILNDWPVAEEFYRYIDFLELFSKRSAESILHSVVSYIKTAYSNYVCSKNVNISRYGEAFINRLNVKHHNTIKFIPKNKGTVHYKGVGRINRQELNLIYKGFGAGATLILSNKDDVEFPVFPEPMKEKVKTELGYFFKKGIDVTGVVDTKYLTSNCCTNYKPIEVKDISTDLEVVDNLKPIAIIKY